MAIMIIRAIFRPLSQLRGSRLPKTTNAAAAGATCQRSHRTAACAIAASRYWTQDDRCPFPALALWPDRRRARLPARSVHQMGGHRAAVARDAARRAHFAGAGLRPELGSKLDRKSTRLNSRH